MSIFSRFGQVLCVSLALVPLVPKDADASVLLATINVNAFSSTTGGTPNDIVLTQARFGFGYDFVSFFGGSEALGLDAGPTVGLTETWQLGETGSVDFDESNSAGFAGVVARITNGIDEPRTGYTFTELTTQLPGFFPFRASAGIGPESSITTPAADLVGNSIDFIRLVVEKVFFDIEFPGTSGAAVVIDHQARFEFWGSSNSVPVSGAIWFLMLGALATVSVARRRAA